jgi:hypothetical protein
MLEMNYPMTLQSVVDRLEITDLVYRYCRSMDRMDVDLGYSIWHEDSVADYSAAGGYKGSGRGFIDWVTANHRHMKSHAHLVSNILIELDGDRAASETYVFVTLQRLEGQTVQQIACWCRYLDQWSRRGGRWGIDKRVSVMDMDEVREVKPLFTGAGIGRRDGTDPSYEFFRTIKSGILG